LSLGNVAGSTSSILRSARGRFTYDGSISESPATNGTLTVVALPVISAIEIASSIDVFFVVAERVRSLIVVTSSNLKANDAYALIDVPRGSIFVKSPVTERDDAGTLRRA
jgi:hypothetical protein